MRQAHPTHRPVFTLSRSGLTRGAAALAEELAKSGVKLVIGGSARGAVALSRRPNVYVGARLGELAAFARGLLAGVTADQAPAGAN